MDGRIKHSEEFRQKAFDLFEQGFSETAAGKALGISKYVTRGLLKQYRLGRLLGLSTMKLPHRNYSYETKLAAVKMFLDGSTKAQVVSKFGISNEALFSKWVAAYRKGGQDALLPKKKGRKPQELVTPENETLEQKVARLEFENEALKKLQALVALEQHRTSKRKPSRH